MGFSLVRQNTIDIQTAREKARTSLLAFSIIPDRGKNVSAITGILKNKPKFSLEGQFDRLINADEGFAFANKIGGVVGMQLGLTKTWSRRIYKGGSYLNISLQARIIADKDNNYDVISRTKRLIALCNPNEGNVSKETEAAVTNAKQGKDAPQTSQNIPIPLQTDQTTYGGILNAFKGLATGFASNSPPMCTVFISNFFSLGGFFVQSVNFEFSHEQDTKGPLYSDLEIELTHSEILPADEIRNHFYKR